MNKVPARRARCLRDTRGVCVNNHSVSPRNRHFAVKMSWLRKQVFNKGVKFVFVLSKQNLADTLTKILPEDQFRLLRDKLMRGVQLRGEC